MPFSIEQFFDVFVAYNTAVWPLQIVAYAGGLAILGLLARGGRAQAVAISLVLALMWAINGAIYHWMFFAPINPVAKVFGAVFLVQAALLTVAPLIWPDLRFRLNNDLRGWLAMALILYALAVYPALSWFLGHRYPAVPVFGIAPCPTVIFSIGVLVLVPDRRKWPLLVIPALWAIVGGSATVLLGVKQDAGLLVALLVAAFMVAYPRRNVAT